MKTDQLHIRDEDGGAVLAVKVVPGASRDKIVGPLGSELKVTTSASPEKGKANQAVARLLAKALGLPAGQVQLVSAPSNPHKEFRMVGQTADRLREGLARL